MGKILVMSHDKKKKWIIGGVIFFLILLCICKVAEEIYDEKMETIVCCNHKYRKCLQIQGEYIYDYDGVKYNDGMIIDKVCTYWILAQILDYDGTVSELMAEHEADGKQLDGMVIDKSYIYSIIAGARVFDTDYYDYYMVDDLISEYELFCETGKESAMLNDFYNVYTNADQGMDKYNLTFYELSHMIDDISVGKLYIEDNKVVRRDEATKKSSEVTPDMVIDACKYYEKYNGAFNTWYLSRFIKD